jgi:uncharacterized cupin superfamily protein
MYLSANEIAAMQAVRRVHQLNSDAIREDKSLGDEAGLKNIGIHLITIAPGDKSTEFHSHKYEDEGDLCLVWSRDGSDRERNA